ncbi:MAG: 30S ribosomal protein S2 [Bacteroidales bacterium]|jgi:small subunit ribosomal protein S2|nr:30S ribosomal protein S2 [Bacteroidales bacterium]
MSSVNFNELLDAGAHFGHLKRKWNPNMAPYIFMEKNGIHIIDLHKTVVKIDEASAAIKQIARFGNKIMFVATKKQAKEIVAEYVKQVDMPYVTERWPGGMLTNFATIRKAVMKMASIDALIASPQWANIAKRERLQVQRERIKLEKNLGSISNMKKLPSALFIVDIMKEHIAVAEARKLNIPTFAIVDTNSDPTLVDFAIPANDDASKSISIIVKVMCDAIQEGLNERELSSDKNKKTEEDVEEQEKNKAKNVEDDEEKPVRNSDGRRRRIGDTPKEGDNRRRIYRKK